MLPPTGTSVKLDIVFSAVRAEISLSFLRIPKNTQYMEKAKQWRIQRFWSSEWVITMDAPNINYKLQELLIFTEFRCIRLSNVKFAECSHHFFFNLKHSFCRPGFRPSNSVARVDRSFPPPLRTAMTLMVTIQTLFNALQLICLLKQHSRFEKKNSFPKFDQSFSTHIRIEIR